MWFKRKNKQNSNKLPHKKLCFHSWKFLDVSVIWTDNGVESDYYELITIGCPSCNSTRNVDELEYSTMVKHKLIIE